MLYLRIKEKKGLVSSYYSGICPISRRVTTSHEKKVIMATTFFIMIDDMEKYIRDKDYGYPNDPNREKLYKDIL